MSLPFSINEFTAEPVLTPEIADKILQEHIYPMLKVRKMFGKPIFVTQKSGYRSLMTELAAGRKGKSEHVFRARGAADYTAVDLTGLGVALKQYSPYTRICFYPTKGFYHCDYKAAERQLFVCKDGIKWTREDF